MARLRRSIALSLLLILSAFVARRKVLVNMNDQPELEKRWFSVDTKVLQLAPGLTHGIWPTIDRNGETYHSIRYCFNNERSAENLHELVESAIQKWSPALSPHTNLKIELDMGCNGDVKCICQDGCTSPDAVIISDTTREKDPNFKAPTHSTEGYYYDSTNRANRHQMAIGHLVPGKLADDDGQLTRDLVISDILHEFGHIIGLDHEHQRPDRDQYIEVNLENHKDYDAAKKAAAADYSFFPHDMPMDERMYRATTYGDAAKAIFPGALDYIRADRRNEGGDSATRIWKNYRGSSRIDFDSIMIYSAYQDTVLEEDSDIDDVILKRKRRPNKLILSGGSEYYAKQKPSAGDIARVAQLYPLDTDECRKLMNKEKWGELVGKGPGYPGQSESGPSGGGAAKL